MFFFKYRFNFVILLFSVSVYLLGVLEIVSVDRKDTTIQAQHKKKTNENNSLTATIVNMKTTANYTKTVACNAKCNSTIVCEHLHF